MPPPAERLAQVHDPFVAALSVGASVAEAARVVQTPLRTVQNWLDRGKRETDGPFAAFAADVAAAREQVPAGAMDLDELREVVARAARGGSVVAMRLIWEMTRSQAQEPVKSTDGLAALDELAEARRTRRQTSA